jgi:uncharacterized membrane protein (DUF106 family)
MEILVFFLAILVVGAIIGIAMIAFRVAFTSLVKVNSLEEKLNSDNQQSEELHCEYIGLPSPKAYENVK